MPPLPGVEGAFYASVKIHTSDHEYYDDLWKKGGFFAKVIGKVVIDGTDVLTDVYIREGIPIGLASTLLALTHEQSVMAFSGRVILWNGLE